MISEIKYSTVQISRIVNGVLIGYDRYIDSISIDTREQFGDNTCFFAIKGMTFDGANYINDAISKGAKLIVTQEIIQADIPVIYVTNSAKALGLLAKHHKGNTKIIGVTGSAGKTTVKDMIISVLSEKFSTTGTYKNSNNEIGVALTLLKIKKEEFCVVEMGMRGIGEIDWLASISEPETSVITNCGSAHVGRLGSKENIFYSKIEILNHTTKFAILPNEDRFKNLDVGKLKCIYIDEKTNNISQKLRYMNDGIEFEFCNEKSIKINSIYKHNIYNSIIAYEVGRIYEIEHSKIKSGIENAKIEQGHGNIITISGISVIDDSYNASFESMREAIFSLVRYCKSMGKVPAVMLGDMKEQGEMEKMLHREIGHLCYSNKISEFYVFGELADDYISGYGSGEKFKSHEDAASTLLKKLNHRNVLLVKASRAMNFNKIIEWMKEKND